MSSELANRLNAERHRRFGGRNSELDIFRSALAADELPFNVLYVFGPGGVGKTTLLREFVNACKEAGIPASYVDLIRLPEADFEVGGRRYGAYGHDWRVTPPMAWLDLLAEREIATEPLAVSPPESTPLVVLGGSDFAASVRDALRNFHRTEDLRTNPLLRSRVVVERAGSGADDSSAVAALRDLLAEAAQSLRASPREGKYYRALHRTYLEPAPNQERAAELLGLPFSTYRRHLKAGISRVGEILWRREIGGR